MRARRLDLPGSWRGSYQGSWLMFHRQRGEWNNNQGGGGTPTASMCPVFPRHFRERASFPIRVSGEGQDGSDPPLFCPSCGTAKG